MALQTLAKLAGNRTSTLPSALNSLEKMMDQGGLEALDPDRYHGGLPIPRSLEAAGARAACHMNIKQVDVQMFDSSTSRQRLIYSSS
jgi:hypothetical protein